MLKNAILILLTIQLGVILCQDEVKSFVTDLSFNQFGQFIEDNKYVLVMFYAPWCGHCKKMKPDYELVAKQLAQEQSNIKLAKVDCTIEEDLAEKYKISGYPTLKFFNNGQEQEYTGGRTQLEMLNWLKKRSGLVSHQITSLDTLEKFMTDLPLLVVYFGRNRDEEKEQLDIYDAVALQTEEKFTFVYTFDSSIAQHQRVTSFPTIIVFKQFDEGRVEFEGSFTQDTIQWFLMNNALKSVMGKISLNNQQDFDNESAEHIFGGQNPTIFFVYNDENNDHKHAEGVFEKMNKFFKGKLLMCKANIKDELGERLYDFVGLQENQLPHFVIVAFADRDMQKYMHPGNEIEESQLEKFYVDWKNNQLDPVYKSEEIPEKNDKNIKKLVAKQFNQIVIDPENDVVVLYYTDWSRESAGFQQIYQEIVDDLFEQQPQITFARCDAAENEIPGTIITAFPSIQIYKKGNKKNPVEYGQKSFDKESVLKFIQENSSVWNSKTNEIDDL